MSEVVHTGFIQAESLRQFMGQLGYEPARSNGGFVTYNPAFAANSQLSTRTAIKLHNLQQSDWVKMDHGWYAQSKLPNVDIVLNEYGVKRLFAAKLVQHVKLTPARNRLNGIVMPPDENANLIRVADESYWGMFGINQQ